jgi:uncharacterized protein YjbI with pentapeptide repeats
VWWKERDCCMIDLGGINLLGINLKKINLERINLERANFEKTNLTGANLKETNVEEANLRGALNLSIDQLSKVRALYNVKLDGEFLIQLKEKFPFLLFKVI